MNRRGRDRDQPESPGDPKVDEQQSSRDLRPVSAEQTSADEDQSAADADQSASDADQSASAADQASADLDERASARDQAVAYRGHAAHPEMSAQDELDYQASRREREVDSIKRHGGGIRRARTSGDRHLTAEDRDRTAVRRDTGGRARDAQAADLASRTAMAEPDTNLMRQLEELGARAAADRERAASDRARAAQDRATAARERTRLEAELRSAHLDELTGAYRREMGQLALSHEIDRARRMDGRFVLAFVDVDGLKDVNDRDGHAAGDLVLQSVVHAIRTRLRTFDPIFRYGGDEFVCGLSGTDLAEAERRFDSIAIAIESDTKVGISVGFAALAEGDTVDRLTERADGAMREVKARHHGR